VEPGFSLGQGDQQFKPVPGVIDFQDQGMKIGLPDFLYVAVLQRQFGKNLVNFYPV
jgi:hypothetical protein